MPYSTAFCGQVKNNEEKKEKYPVKEMAVDAAIVTGS